MWGDRGAVDRRYIKNGWVVWALNGVLFRGGAEAAARHMLSRVEEMGILDIRLASLSPLLKWCNIHYIHYPLHFP